MMIPLNYPNRSKEMFGQRCSNSYPNQWCCTRVIIRGGSDYRDPVSIPRCVVYVLWSVVSPIVFSEGKHDLQKGIWYIGSGVHIPEANRCKWNGISFKSELCTIWVPRVRGPATEFLRMHAPWFGEHFWRIVPSPLVESRFGFSILLPPRRTERIPSCNRDRSWSDHVQAEKTRALVPKSLLFFWKTICQQPIKGALYTIWYGVNRLGDSGVKVVWIYSAILQLLLSRRVSYC